WPSSRCPTAPAGAVRPARPRRHRSGRSRSHRGPLRRWPATHARYPAGCSARHRVPPLRAAGSAGNRPAWPGGYHSSRDNRSGVDAGVARNSAHSVPIALEQVLVGVDAAVAQERPDPPYVLAALQVHLGHQDSGLVIGLGEEFALRAKHMAVAPEVHARGAERRRLVADPVAAQYGQAIGDRVAAMADAPRLALAVLLGLIVVG